MRYQFLSESLRSAEKAVNDAYECGVNAGRSENQNEEIERLRTALRRIEVVNQGCGGNLSFQEMAESAMRQARDALNYTPHPKGDSQ
jgi:hypothetical protein